MRRSVLSMRFRGLLGRNIPVAVWVPVGRVGVGGGCPRVEQPDARLVPWSLFAHVATFLSLENRNGGRTWANTTQGSVSTNPGQCTWGDERGKEKIPTWGISLLDYGRAGQRGWGWRSRKAPLPGVGTIASLRGGVVDRFVRARSGSAGRRGQPRIPIPLGLAPGAEAIR